MTSSCNVFSWTCPVCRGSGVLQSYCPNLADSDDGCDRCDRSGKITRIDGLREAVRIDDVSALHAVLAGEQSQSDLDSSLGTAVSMKLCEHVGLLLKAGADVQAGLAKCVRVALPVHRTWRFGPIEKHLAEYTRVLRLLIENGATVGDDEVQCIETFVRAGFVDNDALGASGQQDAKAALQAFADVLASGRPRMLTLFVQRRASDTWVVKVYNMAGNCVASIQADPGAMTVGTLQAHIYEYAGIPCGAQVLVHHTDNINAHEHQTCPLGDVLHRCCAYPPEGAV